MKAMVDVREKIRDFEALFYQSQGEICKGFQTRRSIKLQTRRKRF